MGSIAKYPFDFETRHYINGKFVPSISGKTFEILNPSTEAVATTVHEADHQDVNAAVAAAKAAFPVWSALSAQERGNWLFKLADQIDKHLDEVAYADAICMGKPVSVPNATVYLRYYAGKALDVLGQTSLNTGGFVNMTFRQPYGVAAAILPWNVPLVLMLNKIGPALATGNTMVVKSSEKAPLSALVVAKAASEINFPPGVLNVLSGFGKTCGEAISRHMDIRKISFTGSAASGKLVKIGAAQSNLKNVTLELGGKSPLLIFEDADLSKAVPAAAFSIMWNSGQVCIASSRVYVHKSIEKEFTAALSAAMTEMGKLATHDPTDPSSKRGPQADKLQFDRVMSYFELARQEKITTVLGGDRESDKTSGYFLQPTIFADVPESSRLMREEIFGSVVCVNTFEDEADAIARANESEYGLYASVYTRDISRALRVAKAFESGMVGVNCTSPMAALDMPFGGWKQSGEGVEMSALALDSWTELKTVLISL